MQAIQAKLSVSDIQEEPSRIQLQVCASDLAENSDSPASIADIGVGDWQMVELALPAVSRTLQIRPARRPCVIEIREISIYSREGGTIWAAKTLPELQALPVTGSFIVLPARDCCLFFNFGFDPAWVLPSLDEPAAALKIVLCIRKDFAAVSAAMTASYAEVEMMAAQVRTWSANRNKTLREFQRQAERAAADRDLALLKRDEQLQLVQLAKEQNAQLQVQKDALESELVALRVEHAKMRDTLLAWNGSRSWRITRPLRSASVLAQRLRKNFD